MSCETVVGPCDVINAYSTVAVAAVAIPALVVSVYVAYQTQKATKASVLAQYPYLEVVVAAANATQPDRTGTIQHVSGSIPAQDIELWLREGERFFGPQKVTLIKPTETLPFRVTTGRSPAWWTRFNRLPKGAAGSPSWGLSWHLPDGTRRHRHSG
jgi:hypothetical protein